LPPLLSSRRISAQGKNILDTASLCFLKRTVDLGNFHVGASEVHLSFEAQVALKVGGQIERHFGRAAARTPSYVDKSWLELAQPLNAVVQVGDAGGSFWWEKLEGEVGATRLLVLLQLLANLHLCSSQPHILLHTVI
jgi:hypothetical protein